MANFLFTDYSNKRKHFDFPVGSKINIKELLTYLKAKRRDFKPVFAIIYPSCYGYSSYTSVSFLTKEEVHKYVELKQGFFDEIEGKRKIIELKKL